MGIHGSERRDVNYYTEDLLRLVTRGHEQRTRAAEAERLAREIRGTVRGRRRLRSTVGLALGSGRRATRPRLEA
jgi:hypothetical protein